MCPFNLFCRSLNEYTNAHAYLAKLSVIYLKCTHIYGWVKQTHTCYTQHHMHTIWLNGQLINLCQQKNRKGKKSYFVRFVKKEVTSFREWWRECIDFWLAS